MLYEVITVHKIHSLGNVNFVHLRDKDGMIQLVVDDKEVVKTLRNEASVSVVGSTVVNPKAPNGVEVLVEELKVLGVV